MSDSGVISAPENMLTNKKRGRNKFIFWLDSTILSDITQLGLCIFYFRSQFKMTSHNQGYVFFD